MIKLYLDEIQRLKRVIDQNQLRNDSDEDDEGVNSRGRKHYRRNSQMSDDIEEYNPARVRSGRNNPTAA